MINLSTLHVTPTMSFLAGPNKAAMNALLLSTPMRGVFNAGHSTFIGFAVQPQPLLNFPPLFRGSAFIPSMPLNSVFGHQFGL